MDCYKCEKYDCNRGKNCTSLKEKSIDSYVQNPLDMKLIEVANEVVCEFYKKKNRVEEIIEFIKRMEYEKIGLAFCFGLAKEAKILGHLLEDSKIKTYSTCCKICGIKKNEIQITSKNDQTSINCNPIGQAEIFNKKQTDLNISFGLCVGHDILFNKASNAPVTTLVVKDRVLGHNPIAAFH